jgi:hypothetical protein
MTSSIESQRAESASCLSLYFYLLIRLQIGKEIRAKHTLEERRVI